MGDIPECIPGMTAAALRLNARDARVLSMVDGHTSVEDIAAAAGLSDADALALFKELQSKGAIQLRPPVQKVAVAKMSVQKLSMGAALQAESLDDVGAILARARTALAARDVAAARELCNLAWMAEPSSAAVAKLKAELDALEKPAPVARPVVAAAPVLAIPDASISKNPKARTLVMAAIKKAGAGDYAGAFRDVQMASVMEMGNAELTRFKNDLERLKKG